MTSLFSSYKLGRMQLANRIVMAPLTRSRAVGNIAGALQAEYYAQRAAAGLIVTEGTSPSPNGLGYARIPGMYSKEQIAGWRVVTDAVHKAGGHIVVQLMHTGRVTHQANLPAGAKVLAPSAVQAPGQMFTDTEGMKDHTVPHAMTSAEIASTREEYIHAATSAIAAGFDGIELHSANGYLLEQFLNTASNQRTDEYGGSVANRARFVLEVARGCAEAIGANRVGIRVSPYGANGGMVVCAPRDRTFQSRFALPPRRRSLVDGRAARERLAQGHHPQELQGYLHPLGRLRSRARGSGSHGRQGRPRRVRSAIPQQSRPRR